MSQPAPARAAPRHLLEALLLATAFAIAHTQSPLYYSNQNQYLLHGAALGGDRRGDWGEPARGSPPTEGTYLANDWLATTRDPTPLFSLLVAATYATGCAWLLQPMYFLLLMGYFLAVRWLIAAVPGFPDTRAARIAFAALFTAAHAAILRWASVQLAGVDYPWYLQAGVAAQYLLGPGIQPSAFGVLLLVALAAFAHGKPLLASVLAASACWFHSTYLLPAGVLEFGFLLELIRVGQYRTARNAGAVALVAVAPVVAFIVWRFDPFGPATDRATELLAHLRIPHHCVPARWFDAAAGVQLAWVVLGVLLIRRTAMGRALAVAAAGGAAITALQLATGSDALALMFPWRISVVVIPVATAVIIAKLLAWQPPGAWIVRFAAGALALLVAGGVVVTACGLGYRMADERELYDYVRATAGPNDVYLLPVQFPAVQSGRGAVSNTFAPPPRANPGTTQIPVDLQRFRLATDARIYVDFKSVPYAPAEVLEWHRRMVRAVDFYSKSVRNYPFYREWLKSEGITHVVAPRSRPFVAPFLEEVYRDAAYIVYRVK